MPSVNGTSVASTSYLDPSKALEHLKSYAHDDGLAVNELMDSTVNGGLTYDDFLMLPGKIDFAASETVAESRITRNVTLKTPFMSSPMDTVTEGEMAISMAVSTRAPSEIDDDLSYRLHEIARSYWAGSVLFITTSHQKSRQPWCAPSSDMKTASSPTLSSSPQITSSKMSSM